MQENSFKQLAYLKRHHVKHPWTIPLGVLLLGQDHCRLLKHCTGSDICSFAGSVGIWMQSGFSVGLWFSLLLSKIGVNCLRCTPSVERQQVLGRKAFIALGRPCSLAFRNCVTFLNRLQELGMVSTTPGAKKKKHCSIFSFKRCSYVGLPNNIIRYYIIGWLESWLE